VLLQFRRFSTAIRNARTGSCASRRQLASHLAIPAITPVEFIILPAGLFGIPQQSGEALRGAQRVGARCARPPPRDLRECRAMRPASCLVLAMMMIAGVACTVEGDVSGKIETVLLNADIYQAEIIALDRLIFSEAPLGDAGVRNLSDRLEQLGQRVKETSDSGSDSQFLTIESLELKRLAARAKHLSPRGTASPMRDPWTRIRSNLFGDRAWFARGSADVEYAAQHARKVPVPPNPGVERPASAPWPPAPAVPGAATRTSLQGRWRVTAVYGNGKERSDLEISDSIWIFDPPRLSIHDANGHKTEYTFTSVRDSLGDALRIQNHQDGWMNYQLGGDGLKIAFFDSLRGRPEGFAPQPGQTDPLLVVLHLRPE
jgi:hypothetical protein